MTIIWWKLGFIALLQVSSSIKSVSASVTPSQQEICSKEDRRFRYNETLGKCVIPIGNSCYPVISRPDLFQCATKNGQCTPPLGRDGGSKCSCIQGYGSLDDWNCVPGLPYGARCEKYSNVLCNTPLTCSSGNTPTSYRDRNGTCSCPRANYWNPVNQTCYSDADCTGENGWRDYNLVYDPPSMTCKLTLGTKCNTGDQCVVNAECSTHGTDNEPFCDCVPGFHRVDFRQCRNTKTYSEQCTQFDYGFPHNDCNLVGQFLGCFNNTCHCFNARVWDSVDLKCKVQAGENPYYVEEECVRNAYRERTYSRDRCTCTKPYWQSVDGFCVGGFRQKCVTSEDCEGPMDCLDGTCKLSSTNFRRIMNAN